MVTVFKKKKQQLIANPLHFTVVMGLYLKQHSFQKKLQRTGLEPC